MSSDVRSLLRQQRAARRIDHPHAAYSDSGRLLCTLCREQLKAESLWDAHLLGQTHKERLQQQRRANSAESSPALQQSGNGKAVKRKADSADLSDDVEMQDTVRSKRSKPDIIPLTGAPFNGGDSKSDTLTPDQILSAGSNNSKESTKTPPGLTRKLSTPSQGVELQIPSRPATPAHRDGASTSSSGGYFGVSSQNGSSTPIAPPRASEKPATATSKTTASAPTAAVPVDESEWAAFEADIAAATAPYDQDAVISAPALTTEEAAAKDAEQAADAERRLQADVDIEDEREEAKRALEDEFDEMKGLEERVDKLKELRAEYLRKRSESMSHGEQKPPSAAQNGVKQETVAGDDGDEDEEDDEEEDDWDSFRFRK